MYVLFLLKNVLNYFLFISMADQLIVKPLDLANFERSYTLFVCIWFHLSMNRMSIYAEVIKLEHCRVQMYSSHSTNIDDSSI